MVVVYSIAGFANGLIDSAWNSWIGDMAQSNELLGSIPLWIGASGVLPRHKAINLTLQLALKMVIQPSRS